MPKNTDTLQDQAPLYINGTLSTHQKDVFEKALRRNAALKKEYLEFYEIDSSFDQFGMPTSEQLDKLYPKILTLIENGEGMEGDLEAVDDIEYYESSFKRVISSPSFVWGLVIVQLMALVYLVVFVLPQIPEATTEQNVQTAAPVEVIGKKLNIVFDDKIEQKQVIKLLRKMDAQIVSGPSEIGLYTIKVAGTQHHVSEVLNQLRQSKFIVLAEPAY